MPRLASSSENSMIQSVFVPGTTYYLALFTTDPGTLGTIGEVSGGSYARQAIVFSSSVGGLASSTTVISFSGLPALSGGAPFIGIFTASTGTGYLGGGTSGQAGATSVGATLTFPIGGVQVLQQ